MGGYYNRLKTAIKASKAAGKYLLDVLNDRRDIDKKGIVDIVTDADRQAEQIIHEIVTRYHPDDEFLSEEGTMSKGDTGLMWIVDPLDGTTNYAHRFPVFCVSIALVKGGRPQLGVIYNPNLNELFTTQKGEGAYLNGEKISVSKNDRLIDSLLATGFPYDIRESENDNLDNFMMFYKRGAQAVRRAGSAALDLAYTACGRFDGFWEMKLHAWDIAAGILMVEEAGGKVTDFDDETVDLFKGEVLASNNLIHNQMRSVLEETARLRSARI